MKNDRIITLQAMRTIYNDKCYGSNVKYLVEIKSQDGEGEVIPLYPRDYEVRRFRNFKLSKQSLDSKEELEAFLREREMDGSLCCDNFSVIDMAEVREEVYDDCYKVTVEADYASWFETFIVGRISALATRFEDSK